MIVADTGPLNYLVQTRNTQLLATLFGKVFIPFEVKEELQHARTPPEVRAWIADPPFWLTILGPGPRIVTVSGLHPGELAAMERAERLGRQPLLIDDQRGKLEAIRRGLPVIGTVGVLYKAALAGIVDFEQQLNVLLQTNFHLSDTLRLRYLELWRVSKSRGSRR